MSNTGTIHIALKIDDKGSVRVMQDVGRVSTETGRKGKRAFDDMDRSAKSFNGSAKMSTDTLLKMGAGVAVVYAVTAALEKAASVIKRVDTALWNAGTSYDRTVKALEAITGSSAGAAQQIEYLRVVSARYGQNLYDILPAYKSFLAATSKSGMSLQDTRTVFEGATKAIASLGLTSEDARRLLFSLQQMVSKGMAGIAEEVNQQMGEVLPGAFGLFSDSLGVSQKKLREMMEQGQLTLNDLVKFGAYLGTEFPGEISEAIAAQNRFNQEWQDLKIKMAESGFMDSMTESIKNLTKVIQDPELIQGLSRLVGLAIKLTEVSAEAAAWVGNLIGRHSAMWEAQKGFEEGLIPAYGMVGEQNRNKYLDAYRDIKKAADEAYKAIKTGGIATQKEIDAAITVTSAKLKKLEPLRLKSGQGSPFKSDWEAQDQIAALEKELKSLEELNKKLKSEFETPWVLNWGTEVAKQADIVLEAVEPTKEFIKAQSDLNEEWVKLTQSAEEYDKFKIDEWYEAEAKALGGVTPKLKEVYELMLKKNQANHEEIALEKAYKNVRDAMSANYDSSMQSEYDRFDANDVKDRADAYKDKVKAAEDAEDAIQKATEKALDAAKEDYKDFSGTVRDNLKDIIKSHESMAEKIESIIEDMLYNIGAAILSQEFIIPIGLKIGSALGATWNGTSFSAMQSAGGTNAGSLLSSGNSLYNAVTGGYSNMFTSGPLSKVGSSIFGNAKWFGTGATTPLLGGLPYYGAAEYMVPAAAGSAGSAGIANTLATVAPYAAIAAIAIPLISKLFKDEPTPAIGIQGGQWDQEAAGSGSLNSAKFNYKFFAQDMGGEASATLRDYFDARFSAVDEALAGALEETFKKYDAGAKNRGWIYTEGMDTDAILEAVSNNVFAGILEGLKKESMGDGFELFGIDFFESIKGDDEDLFEAFVGFNTVVNNTTDFLDKFAIQMEGLGNNTVQAFLNIKSILEVFTSIDALIDPLTEINDPLVTIIDQFNTWIDTLKEANAGLEDITRAERARTLALGAQLTGLTAQNVSQSLQQSIISGSGLNIKQIMGTAIAGSVSNALTDTYMSGVLVNFQQIVGKSFLDAGQDIQVMLEFLPGILAGLDLSGLADQVDTLASKWQALFGSDSQLITERNSAAQAYLNGLQEEQAILEDNLNAAKSTYLALLEDELSANKDLISNLQSSIRSIENFRAGATDMEDMPLAGQKSWLNALAASASADNPDSINTLISGAGSYLNSVKSKATSYVDYAMEVASTSLILQGVEDTAKDQLTQAEEQSRYLQTVIDEVNGVSGKITDLDAARSAYESATLELDNSWMQKEIETLEGILNGIKTLNELKSDYNSAQNAISSGTGASGSTGAFGAMDYYALRSDVWAAYLNNDFTKNPITADAFAKQHYANFGKDEGTKWSFSGGGIVSGPITGYPVAATFHGDEMIIPVNRIAGNDDLIEEIRNLREDLRVANYQIAKNSQDTARVLKRFDDTDALLVRVVA